MKRAHVSWSSEGGSSETSEEDGRKKLRDCDGTVAEQVKKQRADMIRGLVQQNKCTAKKMSKSKSRREEYSYYLKCGQVFFVDRVTKLIKEYTRIYGESPIPGYYPEPVPEFDKIYLARITVKEHYPIHQYEFIPGPKLWSSENSVYVVSQRLGYGSFGQVVKAFDQQKKVWRSLKIFATTSNQEADIEIKYLEMLNKEHITEANMVKAYECFSYKSHVVIVFEYLRTTLDVYMAEKKAMHLHEVRPLAHQLLVALDKLASIGFVHADIKPVNIMMVDAEKYPLKLKLIDFGCGLMKNVPVKYRPLQSQFYRSPENILRTNNIDGKVDMWSVGCIVAEMYLGKRLFPANDDYDQLKFIMSTIGDLPFEMLRTGQITRRYFVREDYYRFRLLSPEDYKYKEIPNEATLTRNFPFKQICNITDKIPAVQVNQTELWDNRAFSQVIGMMLMVDPQHRCTPREALDQGFFTMRNFAYQSVHYGDFDDEYYAEAMKKMEVSSKKVRSKNDKHVFVNNLDCAF